MTNGQKIAVIYALAVPFTIGCYFASRLFDPVNTSGPIFTRAYFGMIGLSLGGGLVGYWIERQERANPLGRDG